MFFVGLRKLEEEDAPIPIVVRHFNVRDLDSHWSSPQARFVLGVYWTLVFVFVEILVDLLRDIHSVWKSDWFIVSSSLPCIADTIGASGANGVQGRRRLSLMISLHDANEQTCERLYASSKSAVLSRGP